MTVGCACNQFVAAVLCSPACPSPQLTGESDCPPAAGISTPPVAIPALRAERRPFDSIQPADWDALVDANPWATPFSRLGLPARVVGRVRRERPRGDARRRPGRCAARRRARSAIVPLMHRHEVEPSDALDPHDDAPRRGRRADAGRADARRRSSSAPRTTPTTRRSWPPRPTCPPSPTPLADYLAPTPAEPPRRGTSSTCAGCAAATRPPTRWPRRSGRARWPRAGRSTSSARTSARSSTLPDGRRHRRLPRDARQEGAPRDPAQGPPRRGGRRGPARRLARPARRPRGVHRPAPEALGRPTASSRDTPGGDQSRVFVRRLFELFGAGRPAPAGVPDGRRPADRGRASTSRPPTATSTTTPASTPTPATCRRASLMVDALRARARSSAGMRAARLPARRRALQVRVGRGRRADPAPPRPANGTADDERAACAWDPCLDAGRAARALPAADRIRVVEVLATGTNGGAQEHLYSLVTRMDRDALRRRRSSRCRRGAPSASSSAPASPSSSSTSRTTRSRSAPWRPTSPRSGADVVHDHMYRAEIVGDAGGHRARRGRPAPAVRRRHGPLEPRPLRRGPRELLRELTPQMDQLIAVSKAIERKLVDEGRDDRARSASSTTASTSSATTTRSRAARCREEYGMEPGSQIVGVVARLEPEKGHPTLLEAWPRGAARRARRVPAHRRRGQPARRARSAGARAADRPPGRVHRPARRRPGRHRRARRRRPAVLPRGAGPDDPRGDGAVAAGRRVERRRHPRDDRGRRHRACSSRRTTPTALAARDRPAADRPPATPTRSAAPATTSSTTGSASS